MSDTLQLCSATLSVLPFVVVQCLGVSLSLSATCNISKYSLAFIFVIFPFHLVCIKLLFFTTKHLSESLVPTKDFTIQFKPDLVDRGFESLLLVKRQKYIRKNDMFVSQRKRVENPMFSTLYGEYIANVNKLWRRRRDSNSRNPFGVYTISSRAPSTRLGDFSVSLLKCSMIV